MSVGLGSFSTVADVLFMGASRSLGPFIPHVAVEEQHRDDLIITEFPVEIGAAITDHSYKRPASLVLRYGWSDSTAGNNGFSRQIYGQLLALQASRQPFKVSTGKRLYRNMLFAALDVTTDKQSEYILLITAALKEVILTSTRSVNDQTTATAAQDPANQADPQSTGAVQDRGTIQTSETDLQSFAGAYNPGAYNLDGGAMGNGSFGLGGVNPSGASAIGPGELSGLSSPPLEVTLPEISVTAPEVIGGLQAAGPDQYNIFGGGP